MTKVTEHFTEAELACSCGCGQALMDMDFMRKVEAMRVEAGFSFVTSSAYRCKNHPIEQHKSAPGAHRDGHAMDVLCAGEKAHRVIELAMKYGMTGIGIKQNGPHDQRFIHIDDAEPTPTRPRPWIWSY